MYKFSNGVVIFDKKTAEEFIKNGYKLIEQPVKKEEVTKVEQIDDEPITKPNTKNNKQVAKHK